ncbi:MAG: endonuclease, partial [Bacilli bacterium]|nr:endonuclease [Bacilli bacterium]
GTAPYHGRLSVLLRWNKEDPVDNFERNRNEVIYGYQNNRNPFIDYPHFADLIWGEEYHVNDGVMIPKTALEIIVDIEEIRKNKYLWA